MYDIAITVVVLGLILLWYFTRTTTVKIGDTKYNVIAGYSNKNEAAAMIDSMNTKFISFLRYLRERYRMHPSSDVRAIVHSIITNYNPEVISENDPRWSSDTSYTVDKGRKILLCLRQKTPPYNLVDFNTLMFVVLHEVGGHIGNYNGWQHTTRFWTVFKFILHEAADFGIYTPVDYAKYPVKYCGITIDYQPLYDKSLPDLWK
jgi:hypothetical protein